MKKRKARRSFGAIRKLPSGKYQVSYFDQNGNRNTAPKTFDTHAQADYFLAVTQQEVLDQTHVPATRGNLTLRAWWEQYSKQQVDWEASTRSLNELNAKNYLLAKFPDICLADMKLKQITPYEIGIWWANVQIAAEENTKRIFNSPRNQSRQARKWAFANQIPVQPLGKVSKQVIELWKAAGAPSGSQIVNPQRAKAGSTAAAKSYKLLRQLLTAAVDQELIKRNPIKNSEPAKEDKLRSERKIPTAEQVLSLALAVPDRYFAAVRLAAYSGARQGELFVLKVQDYDPNTKKLTINKARNPISKEIKTPKTKSGSREVTLPNLIAKELEDHILKYTNGSPSELLFQTEIGTMVTSATLYRWFNPARIRLNLSWLNWHDLRHFAISEVANSTNNIKAIMKFAGHSAEKAALRYIHKTTDLDQEIAHSLNDRVVSLDRYRDTKTAS